MDLIRKDSEIKETDFSEIMINGGNKTVELQRTVPIKQGALGGGVYYVTK